MYITLTPEQRTQLLEKWLEALRSNEYEQTVGVLRVRRTTRTKILRRPKHKFAYCVIGVLEAVSDINYDHDSYRCYQYADELVGFANRTQLTYANDHRRKTFPELADEIEKMTKES